MLPAIEMCDSSFTFFGSVMSKMKIVEVRSAPTNKNVLPHLVTSVSDSTSRPFVRSV